MIIKVGGGLEPLGPIGVYAYERISLCLQLFSIILQCANKSLRPHIGGLLFLVYVRYLDRDVVGLVCRAGSMKRSSFRPSARPSVRSIPIDSSGGLRRVCC